MKGFLKVIVYTVLIILGSGLLLIIGLIIFLEGNSNEKSSNETKDFVSQSYDMILTDHYDSALVFALKADSVNLNDEYQIPNVLVKEIPKLTSKDYQDSILNYLSDLDLENLKARGKDNTFSVDDTINTKIINILDARKDERGAIVKAFELKRKEEMIIRRAEAEKITERSKEMRVAKQIDIRNNFLDAGLDIKVTVKGKDKDHLYLEFALFNDVWFRRFETEGIFQQYHSMGFNKVTLTDGYDYNKYTYWE